MSQVWVQLQTKNLFCFLDEYGNRENITPMKIAKKSKPYIEMEADSFKVCVLPADYAEQFNGRLLLLS